MRDVLGADFELLNQLPRCARISEAIFYADGSGDDRPTIELRTFSKDSANAPSQRTDLMLLGGDDGASLCGRANDGLGVDRLEGMDIQNAGLVTEFLFQECRLPAWPQAPWARRRRCSGPRFHSCKTLPTPCSKADKKFGPSWRSRITFAWPNTKGVFSSVTIGVASRAKRMYFGPLCSSSR